MVTKIQYQNQTDRQAIIESNLDKFLIEEQNIIEGNFLIFSDDIPVMVTIQKDADVLKARVIQAEQTAADTSETQQQLLELLIDMQII